MQLTRTNISLGRQILVGAILVTLQFGSFSTKTQAAELNLDANPGLEQAILDSDPSDSCTEDEVPLNRDDAEALVAGQLEDKNFSDFMVQTQETVCAVGGVGAPAAVASGTSPSVASGGGRFPYELLGLALPLLALAPGSGSDGGTSLPPSPEPVPEPSAILGSGMALGFGLLLQRSRAKKNKKSN